ncbi:SDR family NAD(P)-dependent oxidoreductase [bacterium]|nr:SDR family NAD(P)-dependent oxidoreductase [bacterium]
MKYELNDKTCVVTGASRGIGFHIARALHEAGARVAITGRSEQTLVEASELVGERCSYFVCDQRNPYAIEKMANAVIEKLGAPDLLVNNAGLFRLLKTLNTTLENWNEIIETNLTGVFLTTKAFLPAMLEKDRADIVMISSMSGKKGDPGAAAYAASKFGLQGFSQALMYEVRKSNIRVMVLNPSSVDVSDPPGEASGPGLHLHAADIADTIVHLACLPGRTMIRDMDIYGTNP